MMEILFFAFLTGYMIFRLWAVLGKRTGFEGLPPSSEPDKDSSPPNTLLIQATKKTQIQKGLPSLETNTAIMEGVRTLCDADPTFNLEAFLDGAVRAFEIIVEAFAAGDKNTLKPLLSPSVFKSFTAAIQEREETQQTLDIKIIGLKEPEVVNIAIKGKQEQITVKFVSEQVTVTKDVEGKILDNPAHLSLLMNDIWTFSRPLGSKNPNWVLTATRIEGN